MTISNIIIHNYQLLLGQTEEEHNLFKEELPDIIRTLLKSTNVDKLDLYNLKEEHYNYNAGIKDKRLVIFNNGTMFGCNEVFEYEEGVVVNGIETEFKKFLQARGDDGDVLIKADNGTIIAEWHEDSYELHILFNLFEKYNETTLDVFKYIISELERLVFFPKTLENSWKFTQNKDKLTNTFISVMKRNKEQMIKDDKRRIEAWESDLNTYRRQIKQISDNIIQKRRQVECEMESIKNVSESLIKDLDLIIKLDKVEDLHIKDNKFIIYTAPLYIYSDNGKKYYGGKYRIELNPENSDVHFFGDNPRNGYWTDHDPHPHVDGSTGRPCLGNISSTIAELCSQMQIYALVIICIDYLEAANTYDPAGKNVIHWDEVDADGNIIKEADEYEDTEDDDDYGTCEDCGARIYFDDLTLTYGRVEYDEDDGYHLFEEAYTCQHCLENNYTYDDNCGEYIAD